MNEGPTATLPAIDKVLVMARTLVAFDPDDCEQSFAGEIAYLRARERHGLAAFIDAWTCTRYPDGRVWYLFVSSDGSGRSQRERPDAEVAITLEVTVTDELRNTVAANLSRFEQGRLDPGRSVEPTDAERLRSALLACDESAHSAVVAFCAAHGPDGEDALRALVSLRSQFLADGYVTGEVMGVIRLRQELDPSRPAGTLVQNRLYPIARQIIDYGDEAVVQRVADALRRELAATLQDARMAPDLETYMQALFRTVPTGHATAHIYEALRDHGRDQLRRARAGRIHRQVQEDNARVRHAFVHQATDIGGLQWHVHRHDVEARRDAGGDAAALDVAERLVQRGLYPPALIPALLDDVS